MSGVEAVHIVMVNCDLPQPAITRVTIIARVTITGV